MLINIKIIDSMIIAVCAAGLFFTAIQVQDHYLSDIERRTGERYNVVSAFAQSVCGAEDASFSCDKVRRSGYSDVKGFPFAASGFMLYFFAGAVMITGRKFSVIVNPRVIVFFTFFAAGIINMFLFILSSVKIGAYCPLCIIHYTLTFTGLALVSAAFIKNRINPFKTVIPVLRGYAKSLHTAISPAILFSIITVLSLTSGMGINAFYKNAARSHSEFISQKKINLMALNIYQSKPVKFVSPGLALTCKPGVPVTISVVTDFLCPACRDSGKFLDNFVKVRSDKVCLVYYNFPLDISCNPVMKNNLHPGSGLLAQGAVCAAEEEKFDLYYKAAYSMGKKGLNTDDLEKIATASGMDLKKFRACIASGKPERIVKQQIDEAISRGIDSTPRFYINGKEYRHQLKTEILDAVIDMEINGLKNR